MITIVLVCESRLMRQLLGDALEEREGLSLLATAPDRGRALALSHDLQADVAVVSMTMPEADLLVQSLVDRSAKVVSLGRCDLEGVAMVDDGILSDVVAAIHGVMHGAVTSGCQPSQLDNLTPAECRVLQLVNEGRSDKEVAAELGVAIPTVKHHVHSILTKLGVRRRGQAAAIYRGTSTPQRTPARSAPQWTVWSSRLHSQ
jgi:DNA-binding NarL/FixJ family response regulator